MAAAARSPCCGATASCWCAAPRLPDAIGRSFLNTPLFQVHLPRMPAGAFEATSPTDGKRRLYGYSAVADYPLVIITGRDKADTLAVWRGWLWVGVLAWLLLSSTLALLAWRIGREAERQAALIARLTHSESRLTYLADFDPLTGLPNQNQLRRAWARRSTPRPREGGQVVLILVALERLHEVADLLGTKPATRRCARSPRACAAWRPQAMCPARVKTNEFGLLLPAARGAAPVDDFAFGLHALLSEPVRVGGREFHLAPVIGIAAYPQDAGSVNELMRLADIAKHRARGDSGEPVHFHSDATHVQLDERLLDRGAVCAARWSVGNSAWSTSRRSRSRRGRIAGFEVLLRWQIRCSARCRRRASSRSPKQTGLIVAIGNWVLRTACAAGQRLAARARHPPTGGGQPVDPPVLPEGPAAHDRARRWPMPAWRRTRSNWKSPRASPMSRHRAGRAPAGRHPRARASSCRSTTSAPAIRAWPT